MADEVKTVTTTETTETTTLKTAGSPPPAATTKNAATLGTSTMALRGVLNPNGVETKYWFEFSAEPHFAPASTRVTAQRSAGTGTHETHVEADISELLPNTIYYFRLVAENQYGRVAGAANSFHTMEEEKKPTKLASALASIAASARRSPQPAGSTSRAEPVSILGNVGAIAGLIILIIIVLWGLIHLFSLSGGWFSSFFSRPNNTAIVVSVPAHSYSGDSVSVSWKYSPSVKGNYALLYPCTAGLSFSLPGSLPGQGDTFAQIPCASAYTLGLATSSTTVLPLLSGTTSVSVPLTILYIPSSTSTAAAAPAQGSATMTISPTETATASAAPSKPTTPTYNPPAPTGPADLAISILSLNADAFGNATVTFDIANRGGSSSGTYYFSAQLPTSQPYSYSSPAQASLAPGSHIVDTLNFTLAMPGTFTVNVTSGNDSNASNNYASQYLSSPYNVQYQYNNTPQNYYPYTTQTYSGGQQTCYSNGYTYVCNQGYSSGNGQPYYINSAQYPYIIPNTY